ncbi:hypothetical protein HORIV_46180 [Vreelandella olivaria]|uniref:Gamma-butyrobetaine hydroxylase-like N-terminal domain-containing protein n=1 Tax=Vreelandella olivaria TaxID=390919 RepID=A0ABM7GNI1_9GAMM|nr:hypothetical protein HORIV_46180 [Halomonas olivaria]
MNNALQTSPQDHAPEMGELTPYHTGPALTQAMLTQHGVALTWQDGQQTTLPLRWLRDHCACPACRHPQTRERLYLPLEAISEPPSVALLDGHLHLNWRDGHVSAFHSGWLYQRRPEAPLTSAVPKVAAWEDNFAPERIRHSDFFNPSGRKSLVDRHATGRAGIDDRWPAGGRGSEPFSRAYWAPTRYQLWRPL